MKEFLPCLNKVINQSIGRSINQSMIMIPSPPPGRRCVEVASPTQRWFVLSRCRCYPGHSVTFENMGATVSYPTPTFSSSRTVVVTGGNTGIGYETAKAIATMGARVIIACRSEERANEVMIER